MSPHTSRWSLLLGLALLPGCTAELITAPDAGAPDPVVLARAFRVDVNLETGDVSILKPSGVNQGGGAPDRSLSLMGVEVVGLTVSNLSRSPVGQFVRNKRTIKFDLALTNLLSVTDLVTPTFPTPPAGVQGVLAFPYSVAAFGVAGGKATPDTTWNGTGVPSSGAPFNFFNDFAACGTGITSDCYRWEAFASPLTPGTTTVAQRVGFTVDAGVTSIQVYVVVAADLLDHPPVPPPGKGAVFGAVSSPQSGLLAGVTVTASPSGATAITDGLGEFVLTALTVGTTSLNLSGLPAGCTDPGAQQVSVSAGGLATANFIVTCPLPVGSITGFVVDAVQGGVLPGVSVSGLVGTQACAGSITDAAGNYGMSCPTGSAIVSLLLSSLPPGCLDPGNTTVTVSQGASVVANFLVNCPPPPPPPGSITGNVVNAVQGGVLPGVSVSGLVGTQACAGAITDAAGNYSMSCPTGSAIVSLLLSSLPPGCLDPGNTTVTVSPGASVVANFLVNCQPPSTTTALASSANQSLVGQSVTFTATVTGAGGTPAGTVSFLDNGGFLGSCVSQPLSAGVASCTVSSLASGVHAITASYNGSLLFGPSTSAPLSQDVIKQTTTTALFIDVGQQFPGDLMTIVAVVASYPASPTGAVTFEIDGVTQTQCTTVLTPYGDNLHSSGSCTLVPPIGAHTFTAQYGGDAAFVGSTSFGILVIGY